MSSGKRWRPRVAAVLCLLLAACGGVGDDLVPTDTDQRATLAAGAVGSTPGATALDFQVQDSADNTVRLADYLSDGATPADAVVLYFTMWCPICLSHSDHLLTTVVPRFRDRGHVVYALVDYVSGSVTLARAAEQGNGYAGSDFVVLADIGQTLFDQFDAAMGTIVVIDAGGVIQLNEDYRTGANLVATLDELLP
ncbi:MAG: redoxin domain-containing protein [Deltaproteobacteria bacterium]|nr:redoxin domain-containing protein [Deltaproteobacteria bacterium]